MSIEIPKGQSKFLLGLTKPEEIIQWNEHNQQAKCIAFVGRSNVGKSSLINSIFGKKTARTSKTPGRTRQINIFSFPLNNGEGPYYLFDLPGYGFAQVSKEMSKQWNALMSAFFETLGSETLIVNIQDARHPNQKSDREFQDFIKPFALNTFLAFNKMDKLKKQKERAALDKLKPQIFKEYKWVKQIYFVSAESGSNLQQLSQGMITHLIH